MRSFVLCASALALFTGTTLAADQFRTVGATLFDPDGNEFIAHGINIAGFNHWTGHDPAPDTDLIADAWGFNLVRVNCMPVTAPTLAGANISTESIVDAFTTSRIAQGKKPVVVVISPHESTGTHFEGQQLQNVTAWFRHYSNLYKDNPYVWFNVGNEPGYLQKPADWPVGEPWDIFRPDQAKWENMHQTVIRAIRHDVGSNAIIVADGSGYGQDSAWDDLDVLNPSHSAILQYGQNLLRFDNQTYQNILFSLHVYGMWISPGATPTRLRAYLDAVRAQNLPLLIGEFSPMGDSSWQAILDMVDLSNEYRIGRTAWHWTDFGDTHDLTTGIDLTAAGAGWSTGGGYLIDDPSNPTNLTPYGQFLWDDNRTLHGPLKHLVRGDANLDGVINADDYALLDKGLARQLTGFQNGDFNFDGIINNQDYLLLDTAFCLAHGLSPGFLSQRESQFGTDYVTTLLAAVPEPSLPVGAVAIFVPAMRRRSLGPARR